MKAKLLIAAALICINVYSQKRFITIDGINNKMIRKYFSLFFIIVFQIQLSAQQYNRNTCFDNSWMFFQGPVEGAEMPCFDDSKWRTLNLPHDWSIEDFPYQGIYDTPGGKKRIFTGPFDSEAIGTYHTGYTVGGTGWYRKHFILPKNLKDKVINILFDGIYQNADVWINGHHLGNHPYGYTAFSFDLTKYLNFGDVENIIAVEVKNKGINSRWYSGSGIYRHVSLQITDNLNIALWGNFVKIVSADSLQSKIEVKTTINNHDQSKGMVFICRILDSEGNVIAEKKLETYSHKNVASQINIPFLIPKPKMWSPETPVLYQAECEIQIDGITIDQTLTTFGIRTFLSDPERGFYVNGKYTKLKGATLHADNGPLGAVANDRAEERKVELMKAAGYNAIRCAHNPFSTAFLDACDRLGMLVIEESFDVWTKGWVNDDYHIYFNDWWRKDLTSIVLRDRNHPCIFAWGIGNQIRENRDSVGVALAYQLADLVHSLDPTRAVTADVALEGKNWRDGSPDEWIKCDPLFGALDICGYSYQSAQYENDHKRLPNRVMYSIEINPRQSFGNWMRAIDNEYVIGNFEWTAMDYLGESGSGWYGFSERPSILFPWHISYTGDFDICGFRRPRSYYRDVLFQSGCKLSIFTTSPVSSFGNGGNSLWGWDDVKPSWTWPGYEGKELTLWAYSACDSVSLFLNNKLIGTKTTSRATEFKATWPVVYEPGILKAIGYIHGERQAECQLETADKPAKIKLVADRIKIKANSQDLSFITVEVTDKTGVLNPQFADKIHFSIEGEGTIAAVCNADPKSLESFHQPFRKAYEGKCLVIIRSKRTPGQITLRASANGLAPSKIIINALKTENK